MSTDTDAHISALVHALDGITAATLQAVALDEGQRLSAAYLDARMKAEGVSVASLSERCGMSRQFIYKVLRGEKPLSLELIKAISSSLPAITAAELCAVMAVEAVVGVGSHGVS
jgi:lambda repressor-like predicted transcriptional regulator